MEISMTPFGVHLVIRWWLLRGCALSYSPSIIPTTYAPSSTYTRSQNPAIYAPSLQPIGTTDSPVPVAVPGRCDDDLRWFKSGAPSKSCSWVARSTRRCDTIGEDRRFAYMACRQSCGCTSITTPFPSYLPSVRPSTCPSWDYIPSSSPSTPASVQAIPSPFYAPSSAPSDSLARKASNHPSTSPSLGPLQSPTTASSTSPGPCVDDASWFKKNEPSKDCRWVSKYMPRCDVKGASSNFLSSHLRRHPGFNGLSAYTACIASCICSSQPTLVSRSASTASPSTTTLVSRTTSPTGSSTTTLVLPGGTPTGASTNPFLRSTYSPTTVSTTAVLPSTYSPTSASTAALTASSDSPTNQSTTDTKPPTASPTSMSKTATVPPIISPTSMSTTALGPPTDSPTSVATAVVVPPTFSPTSVSTSDVVPPTDSPTRVSATAMKPPTESPTSVSTTTMVPPIESPTSVSTTTMVPPIRSPTIVSTATVKSPTVSPTSVSMTKLEPPTDPPTSTPTSTQIMSAAPSAFKSTLSPTRAGDYAHSGTPSAMPLHTLLPSSAIPTSCIDDHSWYKSGYPHQDCQWAASYMPRCNAQDSFGKTAYKACCGCSMSTFPTSVSWNPTSFTPHTHSPSAQSTTRGSRMIPPTSPSRFRPSSVTSTTPTARTPHPTTPSRDVPSFIPSIQTSSNPPTLAVTDMPITTVSEFPTSRPPLFELFPTTLYLPVAVAISTSLTVVNITNETASQTSSIEVARFALSDVITLSKSPDDIASVEFSPVIERRKLVTAYERIAVLIEFVLLVDDLQAAGFSSAAAAADSVAADVVRGANSGQLEDRMRNWALHFGSAFRPLVAQLDEAMVAEITSWIIVSEPSAAPSTTSSYGHSGATSKKSSGPSLTWYIMAVLASVPVVVFCMCAVMKAFQSIRSEVQQTLSGDALGADANAVTEKRSSYETAHKCQHHVPDSEVGMSQEDGEKNQECEDGEIMQSTRFSNSKFFTVAMSSTISENVEDCVELDNSIGMPSITSSFDSDSEWSDKSTDDEPIEFDSSMPKTACIKEVHTFDAFASNSPFKDKHEGSLQLSAEDARPSSDVMACVPCIIPSTDHNDSETDSCDMNEPLSSAGRFQTCVIACTHWEPTSAAV